MSAVHERLSAYLDGELTEAESREIEDLVASDPELASVLDAMVAAEEQVHAAFTDMLAYPVPLDLVRDLTIAAPDPVDGQQALDRARPIWRGPALAAACVAMIALGGIVGYWLRAASPSDVQMAGAGWVADIADYHAVYAAQKRHLVEVPASEKDHIETWLTATLEVPVLVPDLSAQGLQFEGGRLLVAAGQPVAQLIFTDAAGEVLALCAKKAGGAMGGAEAQSATLGGFDTLAWRDADTDFVMIAPQGYPGLTGIVASAVSQI